LIQLWSYDIMTLQQEAAWLQCCAQANAPTAWHCLSCPSASH